MLLLETRKSRSLPGAAGVWLGESRASSTQTLWAEAPCRRPAVPGWEARLLFSCPELGLRLPTQTCQICSPCKPLPLPLAPMKPPERARESQRGFLGADDALTP